MHPSHTHTTFRQVGLVLVDDLNALLHRRQGRRNALGVSERDHVFFPPFAGKCFASNSCAVFFRASFASPLTRPMYNLSNHMSPSFTRFPQVRSLTRCPPDFLALENMLAQGPDEDREPGEPVAHMRQEPTTSTSHSRFSRYLRFARRRRHEANDQGAPPPPPPPMVVPL